MRSRPGHRVRSLDFDDHPFRAINAPQACGLCGTTIHLDEVVTDNHGGRLFVCSDTDHCAERRPPAISEVAGGGGMTDERCCPAAAWG